MTEQYVKRADSYTKESGKIYDLIYSYKDYKGESAKIAESLKRRIKTGGNELLEAACGTGSYLEFLQKDWDVTGFDLSEGQIEYARTKLPDVNLQVADMIDYDDGQTYDAVICLFSSIGYLKTVEALNKTVKNFADHTKTGGVVIVEPWLKPDKFITGHVSTESQGDGNVGVTRVGVSSKRGNISVMHMHMMYSEGTSVEHYMEVHELAMYTHEQLASAFELAGLELEVDPKGLTGRGLYMGTKK